MRLALMNQGAWSLAVLLFGQGSFAQVNPGRYLLNPAVSINFDGAVRLSPSAQKNFSFEKGRNIQKVWGKSGDYGLVVRAGAQEGLKSFAEVARYADSRQQAANFISFNQGEVQSATNCHSIKAGGKEVQVSGTKVGVNKWAGGCLTVTPYMCRTLGDPEGMESSALACRDFLGDVKTVIQSMPQEELDKLDKSDQMARDEIGKITRNLKGMDWVKEINVDRPTDVRKMPIETELDFAAVAWLGELCRSLNLADSLEETEKTTGIQQIRGKSGPKKSSRPGVI